MKAELIDWMGDDLRVVNAARVSFSKHSETFEERDAKLVQYLAKHGHFTPFTHCFVTMRETVPIFVARQRFKHTVGFSYNEESRRYVSDAPTFFEPDHWRMAPLNAKQGSSGNLPPKSNDFWKDRIATHHMNCHALYEAMIEQGVAPEQARMVLPQSMYTSYYVSGSLAAWARAFLLRSDPHAQKEIQDLAAQWNDIIAPLFPNAWKALTNE